MASWLDAATVGAVLGTDLAESIDNTAMQEFCDAVRAYVEPRRQDLLNGAVPPVFTPTADVRVGAALMAYRLYTRRTSPLGVTGGTEDTPAGILRHDPDIARLLGIGPEGKFVFGAGVPLPTEEETA